MEELSIIANSSHYRNTICNLIRGSTEGELFPAHLDKRAAFRIFRKAFCRTIPIVFKEEVVAENGLDGYLYSMSDNFLDTPDANPDNTCYCKKKGKCLKKGLTDMTPCYYSTYLLLTDEYLAILDFLPILAHHTLACWMI